MNVGEVLAVFFFWGGAFYATTSHWKVWLRSQLTLLSQDEMMSLLSSVHLPPVSFRSGR